MFTNYSDAKKKEEETGCPAHKLTMARVLPINLMTKCAGAFASLTIPEVLRAPVFSLYGLIFGCKMVEAQLPRKSFSTFNEFFTRRLKSDARPVDPNADLVSPADGKLLVAGKIDVPFAMINGETAVFPEQIKGVSYPLKQLVSPSVFSALTRTGKPIYYCTIYLSPGDYHRFHSPAAWTQTAEPLPVHGELLSVAPMMMRWVRNLLCLNERTILSGTWKYGAFAFIPVGATNVGSIVLEDRARSDRTAYKPGDEIGRFEMGSTVVLLFNGPEDFQWQAAVGDRLQVGRPLGSIPRRYFLINGLI